MLDVSLRSDKVHERQLGRAVFQPTPPDQIIG